MFCTDIGLLIFVFIRVVFCAVFKNVSLTDRQQRSEWRRSEKQSNPWITTNPADNNINWVINIKAYTVGNNIQSRFLSTVVVVVLGPFLPQLVMLSLQTPASQPSWKFSLQVNSVFPSFHTKKHTNNVKCANDLTLKIVVSVVHKIKTIPLYYRG